METRRDVFQAIADPTRREIINLIAFKPQNVNAIASNFGVTRQAVSLHIKILEECGLIAIKQIGRDKYCQAQLEQLFEVHEWIEQYRVFWLNKMQALRKFLDQETKDLVKTTRKKRKVSSKKTKSK